MIAYRNEAAKELSELQQSEVELATIDSDIQRIADQLIKSAKALSQIRVSAAKRLSAMVTDSLKDLALSRAV